jgi:hypothetical protein
MMAPLLDVLSNSPLPFGQSCQAKLPGKVKEVARLGESAACVG